MRSKTFTTALFAAALLIGAAALHAAAERGVLKPYLAIHAALADDSTEGVEKAADKLARAAREAAQAGAHGESLQAIADAAAELDGTDIAALRESFKGLSEAMIAYVRAAGAEGKGVYHCPMANASWVQAEGPVANPYHGKSMLRCGSKVEETAAGE
jgi:hypothetical protein